MYNWETHTSVKFIYRVFMYSLLCMHLSYGKSASVDSFFDKKERLTEALENVARNHDRINLLLELSKHYLWRYTESNQEQEEQFVTQTAADSAVHYADTALRLALQQCDTNLIIKTSEQIVFDFRTHNLYQYPLVLEALTSVVPYYDPALVPNQVATIYANIGLYYFYQNDFERSANYYEQAISTYTQDAVTSSLIHAYHFGGKSYAKLNRGVQALQHYLYAKKVSEEYHFSKELVAIGLDISYLYMRMEELDKSIANIKEVLATVKDSTIDKTLLYANLAFNYGQKYDLDKSLFYNQLGLREVKKIGDIEKEYVLYLNMGCDYVKNKMAKKGLHTLLKALEIEKSHAIQVVHRIMLRIHLSKYYLGAKDYKTSLAYALAALAMSDSLQGERVAYYDALHKINSVLHTVYVQTGDHQKALKHYEAKIRNRDSIRNPNELDRINALELKYHIEKKEKENIVLKKNNEIQELLLKQEVTKGNLLSGMLFVLFGAVVSIYYFLYRKRKLNAELKLKNEIIKKQTNKIKQSLQVHKRTNDQLNKFNHSLKKFFSLIAHDLKSPFNVTLGYTEILVNDFEALERSDIKRHLKVIRKSTVKNYQLAQNLLSWGMSQFDGVRIYKTQECLERILQGVLANYEEIAAEKEISLQYELSTGIQVSIDKNIATIILGNLINNAIKFTPEHGTVTIGATQEDEQVHFFVKDTGIGISDDVKEKLFQLETMQSKKGTNNEAGTGLGLILCKELAEKHAGGLQIHSQQGKGTTVDFYLQ